MAQFRPASRAFYATYDSRNLLPISLHTCYLSYFSIHAHIGPSRHTIWGAVGAGFYPARAAGIFVFTIPSGEFVFALREGQSCIVQ